MRLSEAILLGRNLMSPCLGAGNPTDSVNPTGCALQMALAAAGRPDTDWNNAREVWPLLSDVLRNRIWLTWDTRVMRDGGMTLERFVDWVRSIEPSEDVNAVRLPEISGNEISGERTQNTVNSDRQLSHK